LAVGYPSYPNKGFYITTQLAGATFQKQEAKSSLLAAGIVHAQETSEIDARNALNFSWSVGVGWQFNHLFRLDFSYLYLTPPLIFHVHDTAVSGGFAGSTSSFFMRATTKAYFVNAYVDLIRLFGQNLSSLKPFIGIGIGYADNKTQNGALITNDSPIIISRIFNAQHSDFAYRLMLGFALHLTKRLQLFTQYTYLDGGQYITAKRLIGTQSGLIGVGTTPIRFHLYSNIFGVGLIYLF